MQARALTTTMCLRWILYSSLYIGIMLVVDILYGALDPRIRVSAKGGANE